LPLNGVFRPAHGVGRIDVDHMAGNQPVEQHAQRGQVLLDGRRRHLGFQILDESRDVERLNVGNLIDVFTVASGGKVPGGVQ